jgi:predicted transcriptional regulator
MQQMYAMQESAADKPAEQFSPRQRNQFKRRSKMETYCDIICAVGAGTQRITHILFRANLPWTMLQSYLGVLESKRFIEICDEDGRKSYQLTPQGFGLLGKFKSIKDNLNLE